MKIRTLIVDDERLARQRLRRMLAEFPEVEVIGECADGASAVDAARQSQPDLILLDIQMPGMDGFDVIEALGADAPSIIFVTAYDQHAVRAFEACALDYLLKPVSPARLEKAVARASAQLVEGDQTATSGEPETARAKRFQVRSGQRTSFVAPDEIDWIEAGGNYATLHVGSQNHLLRATMAALESELPEQFLRINRSGIVNLRRVKELHSASSNHFAIMQDGTRVPVTCGVREVQERLLSV